MTENHETRREALDREATQVAHPWRASLRTAFVALVGALLLLPTLMPTLVAWSEENATALPAELVGAIAAGATFVALVAGLITRIMAVPGVNAWLERWFNFGAAPRS